MKGVGNIDNRNALSFVQKGKKIKPLSGNEWGTREEEISLKFLGALLL